MPTGDVQFWIVTGACAVAAAFGVWRVLRAIRGARGRGRQTSVTLTIEREKRD